MGEFYRVWPTGARVTIRSIWGRPVDSAAPAAGDVLTWDGSIWAPAAPTGGGGGGTTPVFRVESFTLAGGASSVTLSHTPVTSGVAYVSRNTAVIAEWTLATATVSLTGTHGDGDVITVGYWTTVPTGSSPGREAFSAAAAQTDFTLSQSPTTVLVVSVNGAVQATTAWSIVGGTTLAFVSGLIAGDAVEIAYLY